MARSLVEGFRSIVGLHRLSREISQQQQNVSGCLHAAPEYLIVHLK